MFSACVRPAHTKDSLLGRAVGMFLGICNMGDWQQLQRDQNVKAGVYGAHGSDGAAAAGRVSYLLGLKGACFSVNTACSSSLVALDSAHQSLRLHTCERSVVAGVCLKLHVSSWLGMCALRALAIDGQCKTFDARANGYGRSEAVGAVVLESDSVLPIKLYGSAVNQDGRSASFMAPNGLSQEAVVGAAMQPQNMVDCIEAH